MIVDIVWVIIAKCAWHLEFFNAKMEQNRKNANVSTSCMSRAEHQMISALTIKLPVVSQHGNAKSNVWQYFGKLHRDYADDILKYWSVQSSSNILCQLAELYLGMASSSVPVDCSFSSAELIANGKRARLKPYKLEQILFVRDNFNLARDSLLSTEYMNLNTGQTDILCWLSSTVMNRVQCTS